MTQLNALKCLDELISKLGGTDSSTRSKGTCALLLEHLQAARRGLLGCMHGEYMLSLDQAKESIACIPDKGARIKAKQLLQILTSPKVPKPGQFMPA